MKTTTNTETPIATSKKSMVVGTAVFITARFREGGRAEGQAGMDRGSWQVLTDASGSSHRSSSDVHREIINRSSPNHLHFVGVSLSGMPVIRQSERRRTFIGDQVAGAILASLGSRNRMIVAPYASDSPSGLGSTSSFLATHT